MSTKSILFIFFLSLVIMSCEQKASKEYTGKRYAIEMGKDTVQLNQPAKAIIHLAAPFSESEKTKIVVYLEADGYPIIKENDSLDYLPKLGFHNLEYDTENQKWSSDRLDYGRTSAIGKSFKDIGEHYLRGYILEYYQGDPLLDSVFDYSNTRKHFFTQKVNVVK